MTPELSEVKQRARDTWDAGDFPAVAKLISSAAIDREFGPALPREGSSESLRQPANATRQRANHRVRLCVRHAHQQDEARVPFDERRPKRAASAFEEIPSQWRGTARSWTSAGRWRIETASQMWRGRRAPARACRKGG